MTDKFKQIVISIYKEQFDDLLNELLKLKNFLYKEKSSSNNLDYIKLGNDVGGLHQKLRKSSEAFFAIQNHSKIQCNHFKTGCERYILESMRKFESHKGFRDGNSATDVFLNAINPILTSLRALLGVVVILIYPMLLHPRVCGPTKLGQRFFSSSLRLTEAMEQLSAINKKLSQQQAKIEATLSESPEATQDIANANTAQQSGLVEASAPAYEGDSTNSDGDMQPGRREGEPLTSAAIKGLKNEGEEEPGAYVPPPATNPFRKS